MHDLLRGIESITGCRDRDSLVAHLLEAVQALLGDAHITLIDVEKTTAGQRQLPFASATADGIRLLNRDIPRATCRLVTPENVISQTLSSGEAVLVEAEDGFHCAFPLRPLNPSSVAGCLAISASRPATATQIEALSWFVRIYGNHIGLLDYSEFDTLTRLLNRKTFDDAFERLIAQTQSLPGSREIERRHALGECWWLAVIDIDHFKHVNDNFGHLFGDEVLLRVANLMRQCFRGYDLLFRFGGEEFIVMLQTASQHGAEIALERFRKAVGAYEFPQVGQVTCSIGYTTVDARRAQTDMLGEADAALYWCKNNGRDRIGCYEALVASGALKPKGNEAALPDIDIDALFN